ncbi:MAG TPA: 2-octaprenyl-6-methoxyphenyl hydroxylase [Gammaproteobacteria bacterium]
MNYDLLIIGGGMVGASLAHALRDLELRIGIVEAVALEENSQPSYDARAIALSQGSKRIFEAMGVWAAMVEQGVSPITRIHVSDRGHFGAARLDAAEEHVDALGYVVEAGVIGAVLAASLKSLPNVEVICPATLKGLASEADSASVTIERDGVLSELRARLVVAADGTRSTARELVGARTFKLGYGQSAIIANIITDQPHNHRAFERFTDTGPLALLPNTAPSGYPQREVGERRWSLVWTARDAEVEAILALDEAAFIERLQARLGHRAGHVLACGPRRAYPLLLQYVRDHVRERLAFIGNAAHAMHPVGGQGFNLGLRDVAVLAEVLANAVQRGDDIGSLAALHEYSAWRRPDYIRTLFFTDSLARSFSTKFTPLVVARDLGLMAMDLLPPARKLFARQAMGLLGKLPRLARQLPLIEK